METNISAKVMAKKLKSLKADYAKIREYTKEDCDLLCIGLQKNRVGFEEAIGSVVLKIEEYLELPRTPGLKVSTWGQILAKKNIANFTRKICDAIPLADTKLVEKSVREGMNDWLQAIYAENNLKTL